MNKKNNIAKDLTEALFLAQFPVEDLEGFREWRKVKQAVEAKDAPFIQKIKDLEKL